MLFKHLSVDSPLAFCTCKKLHLRGAAELQPEHKEEGDILHLIMYGGSSGREGDSMLGPAGLDKNVVNDLGLHAEHSLP